MKKIILSMVLLFCLTLMTGCNANSEAVDGILKTLKKEKIVDKNLVLIDTQTQVGTVLFLTKDTYYIYKTKDSKLIAIKYTSDKMSDKVHDYTVTIYNDVTSNEIEYIDDTSYLDIYYTYQDGKKSESQKYSISGEKSYNVYEKKGFFKTKYKLVEVK